MLCPSPAAPPLLPLLPLLRLLPLLAPAPLAVPLGTEAEEAEVEEEGRELVEPVPAEEVEPLGRLTGAIDAFGTCHWNLSIRFWNLSSGAVFAGLNPNPKP